MADRRRTEDANGTSGRPRPNLQEIFASEMTHAVSALRGSLLRDGVHEHVINRALKASGLDLRSVSSNSVPKVSSQSMSKKTSKELTSKSIATKEQNRSSQRFEVTLPEDAVPGQECIVLSPTGRKFEITVPRNATPGTILTVNIPVENTEPKQSSKEEKRKSDQLPRADRKKPAEDVDLQTILDMDLFGSSYITDTKGQPLDQATWRRWSDAGIRQVKDLFDHAGNVRNDVYSFLSSDHSQAANLEVLCAAVPMVWRDTIHESFDKKGERIPKKAAPVITEEQTVAAVPSEPTKRWAVNPLATIGGRGAK